MATLTANSQGVVAGKFTIPAGIPVGAKAVQALGAAGQKAAATYTARGTIRTEERRRVNTIIETLAGSFAFGGGSDPLAQTFTLSVSRHIAGVDLWFTTVGTNDVIIQIRNTVNGFPGQSVMAEKRLKPADITAPGAHTRILFETPVWLEANREFAIVALSDSATAALAVAELGKFDSVNQRWITSQAYQVGVLLSSSNASTWTSHQDKDLAFRLLACKFTSTSRTISLGNVSVVDASDFLAAMTIDIPATGTGAEVRATAPSGEVYRMSPDQPVALPVRIDGTVALSVALTGTDEASPVVYPGISFVAGDQAASGTYVSRAFPVGASSRVSITLEALIPGTAGITVELLQSDGVTWQTVALSSGAPVGDGWVERNHTVTGFTAVESRVRITLTGTAQHRPRVRKLRAVATA